MRDAELHTHACHSQSAKRTKQSCWSAYGLPWASVGMAMRNVSLHQYGTASDNKSDNKFSLPDILDKCLLTMGTRNVNHSGRIRHLN